MQLLQVNSTNAGGTASVITLTGNIFDSDPYSVLASFQSASENLNGDFGTTLTVAATGTPTLGNGGDGNLLVELEASLITETLLLLMQQQEQVKRILKVKLTLGWLRAQDLFLLLTFNN